MELKRGRMISHENSVYGETLARHVGDADLLSHYHHSMDK